MSDDRKTTWDPSPHAYEVSAMLSGFILTIRRDPGLVPDHVSRDAQSMLRTVSDVVARAARVSRSSTAHTLAMSEASAQLRSAAVSLNCDTALLERCCGWSAIPDFEAFATRSGDVRGSYSTYLRTSEPRAPRAARAAHALHMDLIRVGSWARPRKCASARQLFVTRYHFFTA